MSSASSEALILLSLARHLEPSKEVALVLVERQTSATHVKAALNAISMTYVYDSL